MKVGLIGAGTIAMAAAWCGAAWGEMTPEEMKAAAGEADRIVVVTSHPRDMMSMRAGSDVTVLKTLKGTKGEERTGERAGLQIQGGELPTEGKKEWILFLREKSEGGRRNCCMVRPTGSFVADSEEMEKKVVEAIPQPTTWGEEVNGLKMGLRVKKEEVKLGEETAVEVCIRNASDKAMVVMQQRSSTDDYYAQTTLEVEAKKRVTASKPAGKNKENQPVTARVLGPGESYIETVYVDDWRAAAAGDNGQDTSVAAVMGDEGEYKLRFKYAMETWPKRERVASEKGDEKEWTGTLVSNTATVKVKANTAEWGEAVRNTRVALRVRKAETEGDGPILETKARNVGMGGTAAVKEAKWMEVEVDGKWYHRRISGSPGREWAIMVPGQEHSIEEVPLDRRARLTSIEGEQPLRLRPGKHTVRVRVAVGDAKAYYGKDLPPRGATVYELNGSQEDALTRAASNAVEIEVAGTTGNETAPQLTAGERERAEGLMKELAAPEFAGRQKAMEEMVKMGPGVLEVLRKKMAETKDEDVKMRCGTAMEKIQEAEEVAAEKRRVERRKAEILGKNPSEDAKGTMERVLKAGEKEFRREDYEEAMWIYRLGAEGTWAKGMDEQNQCRFKMGNCLGDMGEKGKAKETYKALMKDAPESDWAGRALRTIEYDYWQEKAYDEGIAEFQRLLDANKNGKERPELMVDMARFYMQKKEYDEAEKILQQVIKDFAGVDIIANAPEGRYVSYAKDNLRTIEQLKQADKKKNGAK